MIVPFSTADFLDRALAVYRERIGVYDEPDQPAASLGEVTYAELGERAKAMAAKHDALGLAVGDRVAFVSHISARPRHPKQDGEVIQAFKKTSHARSPPTLRA